jgi:hypothetical protein
VFALREETHAAQKDRLHSADRRRRRHGRDEPSFAAKKKAKAEAPQPMAWCFQQQTPVCATRGGLKMTYASTCFAEKDGAKVVSQGACGAKKMSMKKGGKKKK